MENTSQSAIHATNAPYINGLTKTYAYTTNYSTNYHPSLPNYLDITSGTNQGVTADGTPATYGTRRRSTSATSSTAPASPGASTPSRPADRA